MAVKEMKTATPTTGRAVETLTELKGYRFLNLTTFRENGVPVVTTVLFALVGDKIYVWTTKNSGKVILWDLTDRNRPHRLGQPLGPIADATARILSSAEQTEGRL